LEPALPVPVTEAFLSTKHEKDTPIGGVFFVSANAPDWSRTSGLNFRKVVLYPLSYGCVSAGERKRLYLPMQAMSRAGAQKILWTAEVNPLTTPASSAIIASKQSPTILVGDSPWELKAGS